MQPRQNSCDAGAGDLTAKIIRRDIFDVMRFIKNYFRIGRKHGRVFETAGLMTDGQVGKKQMMVSNENMRLCCVPPRLVDKTVTKMFAAVVRAGITFGRDFFPYVRFRDNSQIRLAAVLGRSRPADSRKQTVLRSLLRPLPPLPPIASCVGVPGLRENLVSAQGRCDGA